MYQRPLNPQSRLKPCLNCGEQMERDYFFCWNCGAKSGALLSLIENALPKISENINAEQKQTPSLGALYKSYLKKRIPVSDSLHFIAKSVPNLDCLSAFHYEDIVERLNKNDFGTWRSQFQTDLGEEIIDVLKPYSEELFCRGKALLSGMQIMGEGLGNYKLWKSSLRSRLNAREGYLIEPFSRQIYDAAKKAIQEKSLVENRIDMSIKQRAVVLIGIGLMLIMLLIPPWRTNSGSAGYGFLFDSSYRLDIGRSLENHGLRFSGGKNVELDMSRLFVQCLVVMVLTGGLVFLFQRPK